MNISDLKKFVQARFSEYIVDCRAHGAERSYNRGTAPSERGTGAGWLVRPLGQTEKQTDKLKIDHSTKIDHNLVRGNIWQLFCFDFFPRRWVVWGRTLLKIGPNDSWPVRVTRDELIPVKSHFPLQNYASHTRI